MTDGAKARVAVRELATAVADSRPCGVRGPIQGEIDVSKLTVVVAGAGGFIGGHLVGDFLRQGYRVRAADIKPLDEWYQVHRGAENSAGIPEEKSVENTTCGVAEETDAERRAVRRTHSAIRKRRIPGSMAGLRTGVIFGLM